MSETNSDSYTVTLSPGNRDRVRKQLVCPACVANRRPVRVLARCIQSNTCPDIFEVNSENEYWSKDGVLLHVDPQGKDLPDPANVRNYFMASLPHVAANGPGICQQNRNPIGPNPVRRALLVGMDQWVSSGRQLPDSHIPRVADGTLVPPLPQSGVGFPKFPETAWTNGRGERHQTDKTVPCMLEVCASLDPG
jgi:hypothetical protein